MHRVNATRLCRLSRPGRPARAPRPGQRGAVLIESLVAMLIVAFGLLGFIGLQARTAVSSLEGYQRAQALLLVNDMAQRMMTNRTGTQGGHYLRTDIGSTATCLRPLPGAAAPAPGFSQAAFDTAHADVCAWADLIRGAAERDASGDAVATLSNARGCITATGATGEYLVALVWLGRQASGSTALDCGRGDTTAFPSESRRRGVSLLVRIA